MKKLAFIALTIPSFASAMDRITMAVIIPSQLAPIEIVDEDGDTLLHVMAAQGKTSAIKAMLRMHTPDISTPNKEGLCPDR